MEYLGISLREYLIKYSHVSKQFIDDFIYIQQYNIAQEYYPFVIDLRIIVKWLKIGRIDALKRTLIESYVENIDYIVLPEINKTHKRGGQNKEIILVTSDCFKKICLKTKSSMSDKIITYYLALEKLVVEYQQLIISKLIEENKLLRNDLNPDMYPEGGLIYVLDLGNNYYKLGKATDLKQRKQVYDTGTVHKNKVVFWFESDDIDTLEKCIKAVLHKTAYKKNKEVFMIDLTTMIEKIKGCSRLILSSGCIDCEKSGSIQNFVTHLHEHHPNLIHKKVKLDVQMGGNIVGNKINDEFIADMYHNYIFHKNDFDGFDDYCHYKYVKYKTKYIKLKSYKQ